MREKEVAHERAARMEKTMAEKTQKTQKELYTLIAETCANNEEIVEFCEHKIAQLSKPRKTKTNPEVAEFRAAVATWLAEQGEPVTNKTCAEAFEVSAQKSAHALNWLTKEGQATKEYGEKGVAFYEIA